MQGVIWVNVFSTLPLKSSATTFCQWSPSSALSRRLMRQPLGGARPWGRPDPRRIAEDIRGILYTLNRIQFVGSFEADGDDDFMIDAKSSREASMEFHRFDSFWNASAGGECSLWLNGGRAVLSEGSSYK
ncbi:hypothetical protein NMY22_g17471 [Coprinellus aureogranulatus]|nr:hypothetical protein NMY22_g17471 [Coprinellus aureogranulatus]